MRQPAFVHQRPAWPARRWQRMLGRIGLLLLLLVLVLLWAAIEVRLALLTRLPEALPFSVVVDGHDIGAHWPALRARYHAAALHEQLGTALLLVVAVFAAGLLLPLSVLGALAAALAGVALLLASLSLPVWLPWLLWRRMRRTPHRPATT